MQLAAQGTGSLESDTSEPLVGDPLTDRWVHGRAVAFPSVLVEV
jgi:hypothetical protein